MEDKIERQRAISTAKNAIVMAGAGTGKTTLLLDRLVWLLDKRKIGLEEVVVITFTEKAASELADRLLAKLPDKAGDIQRSQINTIHSFASHILRQYPVESAIDPNFKVDVGYVEFEKLFEKEWLNFLQSQFDNSKVNLKRWIDALASCDLENIRQFARAIASFKIPLDKLSRVLGDDTIKTLIDITLPFAEDFRRKYINAGYVSFDGILTLTRDLLRQNPHIRSELKAKYKAILVDEMQDTDHVQTEIILFLAEAKGKSAKDARGVRLEDGKLFLVGDAKQSIYSFRGADIEAFMATDKIIKASGGEEFCLTSNFRSHSGIINPVNALFENIIIKRENLQPAYQGIKAERQPEGALKTQKVELWLSPPDILAHEAREIEARNIVDWIRSNVHSTDILIKDRRSGELVRQKLDFGHIAILFRALTDIAPYLRNLREVNIPFVISGGKYFWSTGEVLDFINLLAAIANPLDKIALVGVLRSPLGATPDKDIFELAHKDLLDYRKEIPSGIAHQNNIRLLYQKLGEFHNASLRLPVAKLIRKIFDETFLLEIVSRIQPQLQAEQALANIFKLQSLAVEFSKDPNITFQRLVQIFQENADALEEESENPLADETLPAVKIFTIHKVKGLEFPVVFLPDLHHAKGGGDNESKVKVKYLWSQDALAICIGSKKEGLKSENCDEVFDLIDKKEEAERKRLLYVGMTRARETLILLGKEKAGKGTHIIEILQSAKTTKALKDMGIEVKAIEAKVKKVASVEMEMQKMEPFDTAKFANKWKERERFYKDASSTELFTNPTKERRQDIVKIAKGASDFPRILGIACHKVLELWDFQNQTLPAHIEKVIEMQEGDFDKVKLEKEVQSIFAGFVQSEPFREIANAKIVGREVPFIYNYGSQVMEGVCDIIYQTNGSVVIADYKTDEVTDDQLQDKADNYKIQAQVYIKAVRRTLGIENPQFKFIFLRLCKAISV